MDIVGFVIGSHLGPFNRFFCDWGPIQVLQWPQASASALHEGAYKSTDLQRRKKLQQFEDASKHTYLKNVTTAHNVEPFYGHQTTD